MFWNNYYKLPVVVVLAVLLFSCAVEEESENLTFSKWTEQYISDSVKDNKLEGGITALVYSDGEVLYSGAFGWADREARRAMDSSTPMPVGSISKIFTSIAIMTLMEEGKINLDDPAGFYLPRLKLEEGNEMKFSVRDLLTHHSGIQGDLFADWFDNDIEILYDMLRDRPMAAEPGKLFSYANIGFSLLGLIIEEVSGLEYEEYVRNEIFIPAGMENSYAHPGEAREPLPRGYFNKSDISVPKLRTVPAGGFVISADDMGLFFDALYGDGEVLLKKNTLNEMLAVQNGGNIYDRDFEIGLGFWLIDPFGTGELTASHGGDLPPYHSLMITYPDSDTAVFVATNDNRNGGAVAMYAGIDIVEELLNRKGYDLPGKTGDNFKPVSPKEQELYSGTYGTMAGLIEVEPKGEALQMTIGGKKLYFAPRENGLYSARFKLFNRITIPIAQLEMMEFDMYEAGGDVWMGLWMKGVYLGTASKLGDVQYGPEYKMYAGSYEDPGDENILEDGSRAISDIAIFEREGRYIMSVKMLGQKMELALRPDGKDRVLTDGQGRGMGDLIEFDVSGNDVTMHWSGFSLKMN